MKKKIASYIRISTNHDSQQHSITSQKHYFEQEVINKKSEYENCEMIEIYADEGLTATKFMRPSFIRMVQDAGVDFHYSGVGRKRKIIGSEKSDRKPKFERILVTNISRLSRDIMIVGILRHLKEKGVYVDFIDNGLSTEHTKDWSFINFFFTFSEEESRDRSSKVKSGLAKTANRGKLFSVHNLYGYDYKDRQLIINETEAEVVRTIFNLYVSGMGTRRIKQHLIDNNIYTRNGIPFEDATLRGMLKNEKYCGKLYRNKTDNGEVHMNKKKRKSKSEWIDASNIEHADKIPQIVSVELFEQCQSVRDGKINSVNKKGFNTGTSEFSNMLICGSCGNSMTRSTHYNYKKDKDDNMIREFVYHFYLCSNKKKNGNKACSMIRVSEEWIKEIFEMYDNSNLNDKINNNKEAWISELLYLRESIERKVNNQDKEEAERLQLLLDELDTRKKNLAKLFVMGNFNEDDLSTISKEIDIEQAEVNEQYKQATLSNEDIIETLNHINKVIADVKNFTLKANLDNRKVLNKVKIIHAYNTDNEDETLIFQFELSIFDKLYRIVDKFFDEDVRKTFASDSFFIELKR